MSAREEMMEWTPDRNALRRRVAVVAGATRGTGRGIAAALGEAGATVLFTGRTTSSVRSEYNRAETIEETAQLVTDLGGTDIAAAVDHLDPDQVKRLAEQVRTDQKPVTSGQLATEYGFTDIDRSQPDIWRHMEVRERGLEADPKDYR
jgi:NAD(P)-dependent dehydrogenase (short-subunit alcohol dehydrogenase family)